jgi:hypothetical protein
MTAEKPKTGSDRGKPASFDRRTGEVSGSGAGAGGNEHSGEDYDDDLHGQEEPRAAPDPRRR